MYLCNKYPSYRIISILCSRESQITYHSVTLHKKWGLKNIDFSGLWSDAEYIGSHLPTRILEDICNDMLPKKGCTRCPVLSCNEFFFQQLNHNSGTLGSHVKILLCATASIPSKIYFYMDGRLSATLGSYDFWCVCIIYRYTHTYL